MISTGYPYEGFTDMFAGTEPTPEWYGVGHKHLAYDQTPVRHLVLADGSQHAEIAVTNPDHPLDQAVADRLRGRPAERPHLPVAQLLTIIPTERPNARLDLEYGQFQQPDTRPAVMIHGRVR